MGDHLKGGIDSLADFEVFPWTVFWRGGDRFLRFSVAEIDQPDQNSQVCVTGRLGDVSPL